MISRVFFLKSAMAAVASMAAPSPLPSASPNAIDPWDLCVDNPGLPYDRPLALKMRVLDGPDFDLMSYRGSPTLLHIFATWCAPCAIEMPEIVRIAQTYESRGLKVVGIDAWESDNAVRGYRKKYNIPFPIAMDANGSFARVLENGGKADVEFPVSLYISPQGYLYCYTEGTTRDPGRELTYRIEKFLKDSA